MVKKLQEKKCARFVPNHAEAELLRREAHRPRDHELLLARAYRGFYFTVMEWRFNAFKKDENRVKSFIRKIFQKHLEKQVSDPELRAKLTPDYPVGCTMELDVQGTYAGQVE